MIAKFKEKSFEDSVEESIEINLSSLPKGEERRQEVVRRIHQDFFRRTVLSSYNSRCCITGLNNKVLLEASHIVGWSKDEANRTNPQNGLCLNVLFHKAYDENLIGISPDYEVFISEEFFGTKLKDVDNSSKKYLRGYNKQKLIMPKRFIPDRDLLAIHFDKFKKEL